MHAFPKHLPLPEREPDGCYDAGRGSVLLRYNNADRSLYTALCTHARAAGLELRGETRLEGNEHSTFCGDCTYHCYYCARERTLRVIADPNTTQLPRTPDTARTCQPAVWQYEIDHSLIDCGMCFIVRASNGHFLLIDSAHGYSVNDDLRICDFLHSLTGGERPVIEGWFFTHAHDDHVEKFLDILEYRADLLDIRGVYYNFPSLETEDSRSWSTCTRAVLSRFEQAMDLRPALKQYRLHTGQVFFIGDLKCTVLCTHEDVFPNSMHDFNDTSTALMIEADGCRICIPGDSSAELDRVLRDRYSAETLGCSVMQVSHHGHFGLSEEFYRLANAPCCLFPVTQIMFDGDLPRQAANSVILSLCKEYHIASNGTVKVPLPYRFGQTERLPDETFEDFNGIYQLWTYEYSQTYKNELYSAYLARGGRPLAEFETKQTE